jgi:hypothetical protein
MLTLDLVTTHRENIHSLELWTFTEIERRNGARAGVANGVANCVNGVAAGDRQEWHFIKASSRYVCGPMAHRKLSPSRDPVKDRLGRVGRA